MLVIKLVIDRIKTDPVAAKMYKGYCNRPTLSLHRFGCAVGNHAFDDHPDAFGITEDEGHYIRAFFHNELWSGRSSKVAYEKQIKEWLGPDAERED
jgi:hypothetical protein